MHDSTRQNQTEEVLVNIQAELKHVAQRNTNSVLRKRGFDGLANVNFGEILEEMKCLCPTVYKILSVMMEMNYNAEKKIPTLSLVYGLIMFRRFQELSMLQRVNTLLLIDGCANQEVNYKFPTNYIIHTWSEWTATKNIKHYKILNSLIPAVAFYNYIY